jgi:hypothetical protein
MLKHQAVKPKKHKCTIKHQNKDKYFYFNLTNFLYIFHDKTYAI